MPVRINPVRTVLFLYPPPLSLRRRARPYSSESTYVNAVDEITYWVQMKGLRHLYEVNSRNSGSRRLLLLLAGILAKHHEDLLTDSQMI